MNRIILKQIRVNNKRVDYDYEVDGAMSKYFSRKKYYIEYTENISTVPKSILAIPFVTNILPIAWIHNSIIILDELDSDFYGSINDFKKGYEKMYPTMKFECQFKINKIVKNDKNIGDGTGCFFSGGLDAFSTLITNIKDKPLLINLQGSDLSLRCDKILAGMRENILETGRQFGLETVFVRSSFRSVLKEKKCNSLVKPISGDNYWHGFQHGIAIIGHAAPVAYNHKLKKIYIAASFTEGDNVTCASDPTIDNFVKLSATSISHDGYGLSRVDKSRIIGEYLRKNNKRINIRVCLNDYRLKNCQNCEKCFRTIYGFIAAGYDPELAGFCNSGKMHKKVKRAFKYRILLGHTRHWDKIKANIAKDKTLANNEDLKWILDYDFSKCNEKKIKYIIKIYYAIIKRIEIAFKTITR